jgi:hypothetical protein
MFFRILVSKNILSKKKLTWKTWNVFPDFSYQKYFEQKKVDFGKPGMFFRILVSKNILSKKS